MLHIIIFGPMIEHVGFQNHIQIRVKKNMNIKIN